MTVTRRSENPQRGSRLAELCQVYLAPFARCHAQAMISAALRFKHSDASWLHLQSEYSGEARREREHSGAKLPMFAMWQRFFRARRGLWWLQKWGLHHLPSGLCQANDSGLSSEELQAEMADSHLQDPASRFCQELRQTRHSMRRWFQKMVSCQLGHAPHVTSSYCFHCCFVLYCCWSRVFCDCRS